MQYEIKPLPEEEEDLIEKKIHAYADSTNGGERCWPSFGWTSGIVITAAERYESETAFFP